MYRLSQAIRVLAAQLPPSVQSKMLKGATYPRFARWRAENPVPIVDGAPRERRERLFAAAMAAEGLASERITYLEFGVHRGESISWWVSNNRNPESNFHGFDSFEGLPEDWLGNRRKGFFDVGGAVPDIHDPRVAFHKGWFHRTLPKFLRSTPLPGRRVFHFDADLYRSTIYPLMLLGPEMRAGDILIFDEFHDSAHEYRAFEDFMSIFGVSYAALVATANYAQVALRIIGKAGDTATAGAPAR